MDVVLRHHRYVEVDHVAQFGNVDSPGRDVGGHQNPVLAALEAGQRGRPLRLRPVAVNPLGVDPALDQEFHQPVGAVLGPGKDQGFGGGAPLEQRQQQGRLEILADRIDGLRDAHGRGRLPLDVDRDRILEQLPGQPRDRWWHRGAEEQGLVAGRNVAEDFLDLGQEAHVEHPVGLIEHEVLEARELGIRKPEVVEQPAWRGDDHVGATAEGVLLRIHPHTAEHRRRRDGCMDGQIVEMLENLGRQFPSRRDHERSGGAAGFVDQAVQDREQEGGGFAAAGHGAGEDVPAGEGWGNGVELNGSWAGEAEFLQAFEQARMELE